MKESKRPILPQRKAEHLVTMTAALLVFIGGLTALSAWQGNAADSPSAPVSTVAPGPLHGLTILVDAGHGGYDGGARCRDSGVWEKVLNLSVALGMKFRGPRGAFAALMGLIVRMVKNVLEQAMAMKNELDYTV